ncbi:MAG: glycosyltransferase family 29 protein [Bacteroidales bacterium]|nr:glycosyltransferase family 29 protein [Bacteroidales bacterium]
MTKLFIPEHLRIALRRLLALAAQFEKFSHELNNINGNLQQARQDIWNIQRRLSYIEQLLALKEIAPEFLESITPKLSNKKEFFSVRRVKFNDAKWFLKYSSEKFLEQFAFNSNGIPLNIIQDIYLDMFHRNIFQESCFLHLVSRLNIEYQNEEKAKILDEMYKCLIENENNTNSYALFYGLSRYICFLLLRHENDKALQVLRYNIRWFSNEGIASWLPVAHLAHINGITDDNIASSSELFRRIEKNNENLEEVISNYYKSKTVAIVGNGPHENGTGNGSEIDSHDIVVRFNEFQIREDLLNDYGSKTNIIVFGCNQKPLIDDSILYILSNSIYHHSIMNKETLYRFKENKAIKIFSLDMTVRMDIQSLYNIHEPTSGLRAVYFFKKILGNHITKADIYGFALKTGKVIPSHYYEYVDNNNTDNFGPDDIYVELSALQDIFK